MDHGLPTSDSFMTWGLAVPAIFLSLVMAFRAANILAAPTKSGKSRGSDVMAYEIWAGISISYLAISGITGWYRLEKNWDYDSIDADKVYGRSIYYENHIAAPMLWYQLWNTVFCFFVLEFRDPMMLAHHAVTAILVYMTLHPFLQYYGVFFFGMPEVTSVPLVLIDVFKHFPQVRAKFEGTNNACRWIFGFLFIAVRLGMWSVVSLQYWLETFRLLNGDKVHSLAVLVIFMGANVFLTGLQWLWGYKIVVAMIKQASSSAIKKE